MYPVILLIHACLVSIYAHTVFFSRARAGRLIRAVSDCEFTCRLVIVCALHGIVATKQVDCYMYRNRAGDKLQV